MSRKNNILGELKKQDGYTLTEILIVVALLGLITVGGIAFFQNTFTVWFHTRDFSKAIGDTRVAVDEISSYMREAAPKTVSLQPSAVYFDIARSVEEWPGDRKIGYFKEGDMLKRYMRGSTTTLVNSGVNSFEVSYIEADPEISMYSHVIATISVRQGDKMDDLILNKKIMLRGERTHNE